jgi:outer membrane protein OmpA-like peptidoglycan-associated protein
MSGTKKESHWIPLADLMTVLMVIFLFISITYMYQVQQSQQKQNESFKNYEKSKMGLKNELDSMFKQDAEKWKLKIDPDLSIKFTDPKVLFKSREYEVPIEFKEILKEFFPKYLKVVMQDKYINSIAEIRIEGHTDTIRIQKVGDSYIDNMELSQNRARKVLAFLRTQECFINLKPDKRERLQFWLTANGLSYGRTVDQNYKLTFESSKPIDDDKSKRVEFRIVTTSEAIINEALKKINKK